MAGTMNKRLSDGLATVVSKFFQQNVFYKTELQIHGNIEVLVDEAVISCSINEKFNKKVGASAVKETQHQIGMGQLSLPCLGANEAVVDAAVSMIADFDETMLSLTGNLPDGKRNRNPARSISAKDIETILAAERQSTSKSLMALVPVGQEAQLLNPLSHLTLNDLSLLIKDRGTPLGSVMASQSPTLSQTWNQVLQYLIAQSQNLEVPCQSLSENLNMHALQRGDTISPTVSVPQVSTCQTPPPNFSENLLQELSNLLNTSQSTEVSDLYNPDFDFVVDDVRNLPVPPNSPTRPESRLQDINPSIYFSNVEDYEMQHAEQELSDEFRPMSHIVVPAARRRTESEVSAWQPQEIQNIETETNDIEFGEKINSEDEIEQGPHTLQESISEMFINKDSKFMLQNDVWFSHGRPVQQPAYEYTQNTERQRHVSENIRMVKSSNESLRHRHMSENVRRLFSETTEQTVQSCLETETVSPNDVMQVQSRQRHVSETALFSKEVPSRTRIRHRSEHTLGFAQVNDEPKRMRHSSCSTSALSGMQDNSTERIDGEGNIFSSLDARFDKGCSSSFNTDVFSPMNVGSLQQGSSSQQCLQSSEDVSHVKHLSGDQTASQQVNFVHNQRSLAPYAQASSASGVNDQECKLDDGKLFQGSLSAGSMCDLPTDAIESEVYPQSPQIGKIRSRSVNRLDYAPYFKEANLTSEKIVDVSEYAVDSRIRNLSGNAQGVSTIQQIQELQNLQRVLLQSQQIPQVDAEVSSIFHQVNAAHGLEQVATGRQSRIQGSESAPIVSPADVMRIRHASVTFSPEVTVETNRVRHISGKPPVISLVPDFNEIRPASETAFVKSQSQTTLEESSRMRHASENVMSHRSQGRCKPDIFLQMYEEQEKLRSQAFIESGVLSLPQENGVEVESIPDTVHTFSPAPQDNDDRTNFIGEVTCMSVIQQPCKFDLDKQKDDIPLTEFRHTCPACGEKLQDLNAYTAHKNSVHSDMMCIVCNVKCRDLHQLGLHVRRHTNKPKKACEFCGKGFIYENAYKLHVMKHQNDRPYLCEFCGKAYTSSGQLKAHKQTHKDVKKAGNICPICQKSFHTSTHLKTHLVSHSDVRAWVCDLCGKRFKTKQTLTTHVKTHSTIRPYVCQVCGKAFKQSEALSSHKITHKGDSGEVHKCKLCEKTFKTTYSLRDHERYVHKSSKFQCPQCDQTLKSKRAVEKHILNKHSNVPKQWKCPLCQGVFPEERYLKDHLLCEHGPPKKRRTTRRGVENIVNQDEATLSVQGLLEVNGENIMETSPSETFFVKSDVLQEPIALLQMVPIDLNSLSPQSILDMNPIVDGAGVQYVTVGRNIDVESSVT